MAEFDKYKTQTSSSLICFKLCTIYRCFAYRVACRLELASSTSGSGDGAKDRGVFVANVVIIFCYLCDPFAIIYFAKRVQVYSCVTYV